MPNPSDYIALGSESEEETEPELEEDSEETEEEQEQEGFIPLMESPGVLAEKESKNGEATVCSNAGESGENSQGNEWNRGDIDGLFCPICMEAWTTTGDHHVCCLPCGHIFGFSCIRKWLQQRGTTKKCPQCNRKSTLKDVRKLFASRVVAIDGESQKRIQSLEAKCISLDKKNAVLIKKEAEWKKEEAEWKKREALLQRELHQLKEKTIYLEHLLDVKPRTLGHPPSMGGYCVPSLGSEFNGQGPFILQKELGVDGARLFDIDASSKIILMTRRLQGLGGVHVLTKISLVAPYTRQDISLPTGSKAVRDLHICPSDGSLSLFASLGKKLSVLSTKINNFILAYDLPAPAWSCSWDLNGSHQIYAGLQNGSLVVFDMRQTARPLEFVNGLTSNPVHTIYSLHNSTLPSGVTAVLSASSAGIFQWNFVGSEERRPVVLETGNQGACISLAYCPSSDDIIASFRPRIDNSNKMAYSQHLLTPAIGQGVQGSHVHLKRFGSNCYQKLAVTCANVNDVRLPRSAVMNIESHGCLFASGDELTGELVLQELPSFTVIQHLKLRKQPIYDVKYVHDVDGGLLGCLCDDILQLYGNHALK
ncbi:hypothetical protein ES319_A09G155500v1 [Gossypium barbadense]|uniref:RING-type E3 ubiquitin transferase n=2 Tax=Gossypium TaxID=3633 RepID=A0A5J5UFP2_GOSBA|nr:hypothetical protein ES319_A09G155500v1 [Gossypium barbadense]TYH02891.1 hypothetical protein ES288_A09G176800v1 [Gossypium darwinii]